MSELEAAIDDLYKAPLDAFVRTRAALAKTLAGADAKRVKGLSKPTVVPWAVNQVHWHARPTYDRLMKAGEQVRAAQISVLKGRSTDVREANAAHRAAVVQAVGAATRLASAAGVHADTDTLARMFESVSLARSPAEPHGRFTKAVAPAGFEALAGVEIAPAAQPPVFPKGTVDAAGNRPAADSRSDPVSARMAAHNKRVLQLERERLAEEQRKRLAITEAEVGLSLARAAEVQAREAWHRAKDAVEAAERNLKKARE